MMSSSSPVSSSSATMLREPNNNKLPNNRGLIKANSFSFRRRYFLKPDDHPVPPPSPLSIATTEDHRQSTFIRPQIETRTSYSLRSFRSSLESKRSGGFLDKNSNHSSYPTSPTTTNSSIRNSSSACSTPPVSPHRIPIFRNSMPKTGGYARGIAGATRMTGVQQLSTSWEFIR